MVKTVKTVVLLGPKHSGKTGTGRELAVLCSRGFFDLDEIIAERSGKSPRELYLDGPEIFQKAEAAALASLFAETENPVPVIIACGGGLADNPEAYTLLAETNAKGTIIPVFIHVSAATAWERLCNAGELPPFLRTGDPREIHRSMHERRSAVYRNFAVFTVNAGEKTPVEIAGEIFGFLTLNTACKHELCKHGV